MPQYTEEYTKADAQIDEFWNNAELQDTVGDWELWTDGATIAIVDTTDIGGSCGYLDYETGMDQWSEVGYEASHPYAERR